MEDPAGIRGANDRWIGEMLAFAPVPSELIPDWLAVGYLVRGANNPTLSPRAKARVFELIAESPDRKTKLFLAAHPETPEPVLEMLMGDLDLEVRESLEQRTGRSLQREIESAEQSSDAALLSMLARSPHDAVRLALSRNPALPDDAAVALASDPLLEVRTVIASRSAVPAALAVVSTELPLLVARNPACNSETLEQLARHPHAEVRFAVVRHPSTPVGALERLASDSDPKVSAAAYEHPHLPAPLRARGLADRALAGERRALDLIAAIDEIPIEILRALAASPNPKARMIAARSPSCPPDVRAELLEGSRAEARRTIVEGLRQTRMTDQQIEQYLAQFEPQIEQMAQAMMAPKPKPHAPPILSRPSPAPKPQPRAVRERPPPPTRRKDLPPEEYEKMARESPQLRRDLALNDAVPVHVLDLIQREGNLDMKRLVALNPSAGPILGSIDHDGDLAIDVATARSERAPAEVRARAAERLAARSEDHARAAAAGCSDAAQELLDRLARDPREIVRLALQRHPRGRQSLLAVYAQSTIPFVRHVAMLHPEASSPRE